MAWVLEQEWLLVQQVTLPSFSFAWSASLCLCLAPGLCSLPEGMAGP